MLRLADISSILMKRMGGLDYHNSFESFPSPWLLKDLNKAIERTIFAISKNQKIVICGDYDVDGVTASTVWYYFFKGINYTNFKIHIPHREHDGYGISPHIIEKYKDADLIITVDNGISAIEAADYAKSIGLDLIITDHHMVGDILPDAYAIVDPKQPDCPFPFKELCGAAVAWFYIVALNEKMNLGINTFFFLDIVAIGTVADVVSLVGLNNYIVRAGLQYLNLYSNKTFISILKERAERYSFDAESIGFIIGPLINAAGRLDHAEKAFNFLIAETYTEANNAYNILEDLNKKRKDMQDKAKHLVLSKINKDEPIIIECLEIHPGIVGSTAGAIAEITNKPTLLACTMLEPDGTIIIKGSGRGHNIDIYDFVMNFQDLFIKCGGHVGAVGFSITPENFETFKLEALKQFNKANKIDISKKITSLGELDFRDISMSLMVELNKFEPYGEGNPKPILTLRNARVIESKHLGKTKSHISLSVTHASDPLKIIKCVKFNDDYLHRPGDFVSFNYNAVANTYRGKSDIQLIIKEFI